MTSREWRDSMSPAAQDHFDDLYAAGIDAATVFIRKRGQFSPFAFGMGLDGEIGMFAADPGPKGEPTSLTVLSMLRQGARADREELQAVVILADASLADGADAVRLELEHCEGVALQILVPYRRRRVRRDVELGEMMVSPGDWHVWDDPQA